MKKIILFIAILFFTGVIVFFYEKYFPYIHLNPFTPAEGTTRTDPECEKKAPTQLEKNWCTQIYHNGQWLGTE